MKVATFYRFLDLDDVAAFRSALFEQCERAGLLGTILVADEGLNGTVTGSEAGIRRVLTWIESRLKLESPIEVRWSDAETAPFRRLRVREKKEIVTLGRPDIQPHRQSGEYVTAEQWNALLDDPEVLVIDTRNRYEIEVGSFPGAVDPQTNSFRDFSQYAQQLAEQGTDRPLAMFCTGGIRCEKATALMLELGFDDVFHLQGGILRYLEDNGAGDNRWQGECFVFDTRVAVDRDLAEGGYEQCHACRRPLGAEELASPDYRTGISCPSCIDSLDPQREEQLAERRRQVELAEQRGEQHIGPRSGAVHTDN